MLEIMNTQNGKEDLRALIRCKVLGFCNGFYDGMLRKCFDLIPKLQGFMGAGILWMDNTQNEIKESSLIKNRQIQLGNPLDAEYPKQRGNGDAQEIMRLNLCIGNPLMNTQTTKKLNPLDG